MKKTQLTKQEENDLSVILEETGITRKAAIRKLRRRAKLAAAEQAKRLAVPGPSRKPRKEKVVKPTTDAGKARSAGIQDFILAGRPTKEQFIAVYGEAGPRLTWVQRAALGVDAEHFQRALKAGKCVAPAKQSQGAVA
jgi:hypothetical protein